MATPNLLFICGTALLAVFVVLTILAAVMQVLMRVFPHRDEPGDSLEPTLATAITEGVAAAYPGTKVTRIEELS